MATTYSGRIFEVGDVIYFSKFGTSITSGYASKSGSFGTCYGTISRLYGSSYAFPIVINGTVHAGTGGTFTACTVKPSDCTSGYQVTVTYNHQSGSGTSSQAGYVGASLTGTSSRTGYQFAGWYTDASGGSKVTKIPTDSVTYYARWTGNTYYVKFNGNGNTGGSTAQETFTYGTAKALTSNGFTKTGYTFKGWATSQARANAGTVDYTNQKSVSNLTTTNGGTVNLYAVWTANTYYVSFNGNGNTGGSTAKETFTYGTAKALTSNGFTKTGYTFSKWNTKSDGSGTNYTNGQSVSNLTSTAGGTVTLYAIWTANTYYVKFNGNNNTGGSTAQETFTYGTAKALTANGFTRTGYTFSKWNTNSSGTGTSYTNGQSVSNLTSTSGGTVNLYAIWTANTYYVQFNGNGNTGGSTAKETFTYGTAKALTANGFTKTGYTFKGWATSQARATAGTVDHTDKKSVSNLTSTAGGTVNLYAVWQANTYTVKFNGNSATSGTMADQSFTYDTAQNLRANSYSKGAAYAFDGWNTAADGTGTDYSDEQSVSNLTATSGGTVTLYAKWLLQYLSPTINNLTVLRYEDGIEADDGTQAHITFTWAVDTIVYAENYATSVKVQYKERDATAWTTLTEVTFESAADEGSQGGTFTYTSATNTFDTDITYDFLISISDYYGPTVGVSSPQATATDFLSLAFFTMDWAAGGKGIGIGTPAPTEGLNIAMATKFLDEVVIDRSDDNGYKWTFLSDGELQYSDLVNTIGDTFATNVTVPGFAMRDAEGFLLGRTAARYVSDGKTGVLLETSRVVGGERVWHGLGMYLDASGNYTVSVSSAAAWRSAIGAVNKAGDTMTGDLVIHKSSPAISLRESSYTVGTVPSATMWRPRLYFNDSANVNVGHIGGVYTAANLTGIQLETQRPINGSTVYNAVTLYIDNNGTRSVSVSDAAIWRSAIGLSNSKVNTISSVITVDSTNATITTAEVVKYGNLVSLHIVWTNKNAISVPANGNISNFNVGTLASGYRPAYAYAGWSKGDNAGAAWYGVSTGGVIYLAACEGTGTARSIAAGTTFEFYSTFVAA